MPGMDGLEFAVKTKELYKELVEQSQPPIVLCSADYSSKLRSKCVRAGIERKFLFVDCEMIFYFFPRAFVPHCLSMFSLPRIFPIRFGFSKTFYFALQVCFVNHLQ